jgi:ribosome-associated protein
VKNSKKLAEQVVQLALSKRAEHLQLLDLRGISPATDFYVIGSGRSDVQVKAIADSIIEGLKKSDIRVWHVEGYENRRWVLLDLVDVVVHIFLPDIREYYSLERLWGDAPSEKFSDEDGEPVKKAG